MQAERTVEVFACTSLVALGEQDQAQVVLDPSEVQLVAEDLEQGDGAVGEPCGHLDLADLSVRVAQAAVHQGQPAEVVDVSRYIDGLLVGDDRGIPLLVAQVRVREYPQKPGLGGVRDRIDAAADRQRPLGERDATRLLRQVREGRFRPQALGEHQLVVRRLEVRVRITEQDRRLFRPGQVKQRERHVVTDAPQAVGRGAEMEEALTELRGLGETVRGDQAFQLDDPGLGLVGRTAGIGKEELDRLAGASGDVLERGQRRPRPAGFDQVDGRSRDLSLAQLRQAHLRLESRLLDRARPEIDAG